MDIVWTQGSLKCVKISGRDCDWIDRSRVCLLYEPQWGGSHRGCGVDAPRRSGGHGYVRWHISRPLFEWPKVR